MKEFKAAKSWQLLLTLAIVFTIYSCSESSSVVGTSIINTSENFRFDTLEVGPFNQTGFSSYTGRLLTIAAGGYNDPIYGQLTTRALIKPSITFQPEVDGIVNVSTIDLQVVFSNNAAWGDTTVPTQFNVYRVNNLWRGIAWQYDDQILFDQVNPVATFQRTSEDTVTVPMSADWVQEYGDLYNADEVLKDSLFTFEFNGLVITAEDPNSNAISFLNINSTHLLITRDPSNEDDVTTEFDMEDWAYSVERPNIVVPNERLLLNSTNEVIFSADFIDQLQQFRNSNIVNVELLLHEDTETLSNSLPAQHVRVNANVLETHLDFGLDPSFDLTFGTGDSLGVRDVDTNIFRFNLTAYVNAFLFGEIDETEFFFSIVERSGLLSSTLIYDAGAADVTKRPQLIITTLGE